MDFHSLKSFGNEPTSGSDPTQADWDALKLLAGNTAKSQLTAALVRAGIPLDDLVQ
jgi:hypothetical protein